MRRIAKQKRMQSQQFYQKQSMERLLLVMAIVMTIASFNVSAMVRTKERSSDWYDNIVLGTFTHREWIENFRMTQETFLCL